MDAVRQHETEKYRKMWDVPQYRVHSPGYRHVNDVYKRWDLQPGDTVLDFGVGSGKAADFLCKREIRVHGIDIVDNCLDKGVLDHPYFTFSTECLWDMDKIHSAEYIYCTDVMEHIPPEHVDEVLDNIDRSMLKAGYFSISCTGDNYGPKYLNEELHLTVRSPQWWAERLEERWDIDWHQEGSEFTAFVYPKGV
jgi:cyclopropane fatty-acyl-phospholipid synthase-like methyltransferase